MGKTYLHFPLRFCWFRVKEVNILLFVNRPACPVRRLLKCAVGSTFKRLILATPLSHCLLTNMSISLAPNDLRNQDCKKGQVTAQSPISCAQFKYKPWVFKPETINLKLAEDNTFTCNLMNDLFIFETYLKWILVYLCVREEKKLDEKLQATMWRLVKVREEVKKLSKIPKKESADEKAERELEVVATNLTFAEAKDEYNSAIGACYDLFLQLLADEPQIQWDHIVVEVHNNDPWTGLDGVKHKGICMVAWWNGRRHMMGSLKKPHLQNFKWVYSLVTNAQRQRVSSHFHQEGEHCIQ
jgi:hypothetical protein